MQDHSFEIEELSWAVRRIGRDIAWGAIPISFHLRIARWRGWIYTRGKQPPSHVEKNLEEVFGDTFSTNDIRIIGQQHQQFMQRRYLARVLPNMPRFDKLKNVNINGIRNLDRALELNKGVLLTTGHFGLARLIVPILRSSGYESFQVEADTPELRREIEKRKKWLQSDNRFLKYIYKLGNLHTEPIESYGIPATLDVRPVFSALSENKPIMIVGDGMRSADFTVSTLFNRPYPFPNGLFKFSMTTGAPILPVFAIEGKEERRNVIQVDIHPPLSLDSSSDIASNVERYACVLEQQLLKNPHYWHRWSIPDFFKRARDWAEGDRSRRVRWSGKWHL